MRELFDAIAHTARLREVERHNNATADRRESVAEHSWHLALVCWLCTASSSGRPAGRWTWRG
ncbi:MULTISPECIES: HD domain-containing protein [Streptomyces]|uniref:HD domain-containing protein n=1 Tax=Streptomyces TaxID=1883 RepID=UPI0017B1AAA0|nr:HD domain-containing protein [Streptomyces murinus]MBA9049026.1 5'-deoxynucleotidase YfbR-like HD superfamily hydrolase [Streptomyces murinus]